MIISTWFRRLLGWTAARRGRQPSAARLPGRWKRIVPRLEGLEDRLAPAATVQFGQANEALLETAGSFAIPVNLSAVSAQAVSVPFTLSGTAVLATDFAGVIASPLIIPAGSLSANITGALFDDGPLDVTKNLIFTLGTPTNAALGSTTVNTLNIEETPLPTTLSIANQATPEPAAGGTVNMVFTATRTGDLTSQLTIGFTTAAGTAQPGTDFTPTTGTTTFAAGSATATIAIPIFGNGVFNSPSLTFSVHLTGIVSIVGPPVSLGFHSDFTTGTIPDSVAVADMNGDGKPDIVVANRSDNDIAVLWNTTPTGSFVPTFAAPVTFAVGVNPTSVAISDVNGDGLPDVVVANYGSDNVSVLLNTTTLGSNTPSFATQQTFTVGIKPVSVAIGDVNGDGQPDLVVANYGSSSVSVLLNTTTLGSNTPSFAAQQTFATGTNPDAVAIGDLNQDARPDLAVANFGSNSVSVLLNKTAPGATTASFPTQQTFAAGTKPDAVAIGDLNADGKPDLAVANFGSADVSVLLNTTAPGAAVQTFLAQQTFATGVQPFSVAIGDLNGDAKPDISVANVASNTVSVLANTTAPGATALTFAAQQTAATGTEPFSLALGDINGDGNVDLVVADESSGAASVILNTTVLGAATVPPDFPQTVTIPTGSQPFSVTIGDLNGDGKPDVVVTNFSSNTVSVLLNTTAPGASTPTFAAQQTFAVGTGPTSVAIADVNGDGKPDLLVTNHGDNTLSVLRNTTTPGSTTPTFAAQQTFATGSFPYSVAIGDLNGDGMPDVAIANRLSSTVSVLLNTTAPGSATVSFAQRLDFTTGANAAAVVIGDVSGDGKPDLIVADEGSASVSVLLNTTTPGSPTPSFAPRQDFATGRNPIAVALGDVNGDGKPDLVVANNGSASVSVLLNNTTPGAFTLAFAAHQDFPTGSFPTFVALGDLNNDGRPDLAVANQASGTLSVLLNATAPGATAPSFGAQKQFTTGSSLESVAIGDLNGDGRLDLAVTNASSGSVSMMMNTPVVILGNVATGTIIESDPIPSVQFTAAADSVIETVGGATPFTITVVLSAVSGSPMIVPFTVGGSAIAGSDFSLNAGSPLVIPAGRISTTITGVVNDIGLAGTIKTATFILGSPTNAVLGVTTINTLTISKPVPSVQFGTAGETINDHLGNFQIPVTLSTASQTDTTIPFTLGGTAVAGTDFSGLTTSPLTIPAGQTTGFISGTLKNVGTVGAAKLLTITLGTPVNGTLGALKTNTLTISKTAADMTVTETHSGSFVKSGVGAIFTITVKNIGNAATIGTVSLHDALPGSFTATSFAGTGWTVNLATLTATRTDALAAGKSYPTLTLKVNVSRSAKSSVTNIAAVSGGGEFLTANDAVSDKIAIGNSPLLVTAAHIGRLSKGEVGAILTITVENTGTKSTSGTISLSDALPGGLTATSFVGTGWTVNLATLTARRSDPLAAGKSYATLTLKVNVSRKAANTLTNFVTVVGSGVVVGDSDLIGLLLVP